QALVAVAFWYLHRARPGPEVMVLQVPRGEHDVALCVALAAQVSQLNRLSSVATALLCPWKGSIVVVGHNTAVQSRLGDVQVRGARLQGGVANALRVYRLRRDGDLAAPDGSVCRHTGGWGRLLYLNTRIGWPAVSSEKDPLVIVDATRIG